MHSMVAAGFGRVLFLRQLIGKRREPSSQRIRNARQDLSTAVRDHPLSRTSLITGDVA